MTQTFALTSYMLATRMPSRRFRKHDVSAATSAALIRCLTIVSYGSRTQRLENTVLKGQSCLLSADHWPLSVLCPCLQQA